MIIPSDTADLAYSRFNLYLIGCGGTGSFAAQHLARLITSGGLASERVGSLTLVDFDLVELVNVGRQLFSPADLGKPKAADLAQRCSAVYGLKIGVVDRAAPRLELLAALKMQSGHRQAVYWFDACNGRSAGQAAWGNTADSALVPSGVGQPIVEYLPYPRLVFPETIDPANDRDEFNEGCAEQAGRQGLNINAVMGYCWSRCCASSWKASFRFPVWQWIWRAFRWPANRSLTSGWRPARSRI